MIVLIIMSEIRISLIIRDVWIAVSNDGLRRRIEETNGLYLVIRKVSSADGVFNAFIASIPSAVIICHAASIILTLIISISIMCCSFIVILNVILVVIFTFIFMVRPFTYEIIFITLVALWCIRVE